MSNADQGQVPVGSVYFHVPFCSHKCEYCAFYSELLKKDQVTRYTDALCRELRGIADRIAPQTIFFGGGTPSLLPLSQWETILETLHALGWNAVQEWTVECNPATVSKEKAALLKEAGVNRISMGVQSLDASLLTRLGRIHSREQVFKSFDILRSAGFENINLDLMFAIPGQTREIWQDTLSEIFEMGSDHLSCYEVIYEEDTALFHQLQAGEFDVDDALADEMYRSLVDRSEEAGFQQYEIANFARQSPEDPPSRYPARAARHNINYWESGDYYAVGPAATEFVGGCRRKHWSNTQLYCDQVDQGKRGIEFEETLSPAQQAGEAAAFALRMNAGMDFRIFEQRFGMRPAEYWSTEITDIQSRGWGILEKDSFRLSREGLRFADAAGSEFIHLES